MEQDDFRKLLSAGDGSVSSRKTLSGRLSKKRPFSQTTTEPTLKASSMAPRRVKNSNPFAAGRTEQTEDRSDLERSRIRPAKSLLAKGYTDRAKQRNHDPVLEAEQERIDNLKTQLKQKEITHREYLERVETFASGEFQGAGMVRGLDRKLLERVRAGEDVLDQRTQAEKDSVDDALEAALDQHLTADKKEDSKLTTTTTTTSPVKPNRASVLAGMKRTQSVKGAYTSADTAPRSIDSKFKPLLKRNKDGTLTETRFEAGKKIKIIRDANGTIVKKLVKKTDPHVKDSPVISMTTTKSSTSTPAAPLTVQPDIAAIEPYEDDGDIFSDAGEYDPFTTSGKDDTAKTNATLDNSEGSTYFARIRHDAGGNEDDDDNGPTVASTAEEFLRANKAALEKAATILDRQTAADQEKLRAKQRTDAGFGLVFHSGDAYAGDVRELPEEDEMYDGRRRKGGKEKEKVRPES